MNGTIRDDDRFPPVPFMRGRLEVEQRDRDGNLIPWPDGSLRLDLGENAIMPRSRLVASRLFAQNLKAWAAAAWAADWTGYAGTDFTGGVDVGSYNYPFAEDTFGLGNSIVRADVFGGVGTVADALTGHAVVNQNVDRAFHHGAGALDAKLYSLGVTGMCFGNCGHLLDPRAVAGGIEPDPSDNEDIVLADYQVGVSHDDNTKPAEPWNPLGTGPGYTWPGGGLLARYPNLHQPNAFLYEPVVNGIVPWGYAGLYTIEDNMYPLGLARSGAVRAAYEGNTTLYSETGRFPLDKGDGVTFPDGSSVRFKCTVPADCEMNQERNFGYGRRPRNWITEAGLVTGENVIVQSPDARFGATVDPAVTGLSNVWGAQLVSSGSTPGTGLPYSALPKDYFTRLRDPLAATWFLKADGQMDTALGNNTWNLVARKVFGIITKTQAVSYSFLWTITFG